MNLAPTKRLISGYQIPMAGLGLFDVNEQRHLENLIESALEIGYRHFDTAIKYRNEKNIGSAFNKIFEKQKFKREDIYLTSKAYPFKGQSIVQSVEFSLQNFNTPYLDLYLLHWPGFAPNPSDNSIQHKPSHVAWSELEECVDKGYVRSIGVCNYNVQMLFNLLSFAKIKPAVNQVEIHPYLQQPGLRKFCKQFDIHNTAFCPLGRAGDLFHDPVIVKLAEKYDKTAAQIILNFLTEVLHVSVIPKTGRVERLKENFDWRDFTFSEEDIAELISLDKNWRILNPETRGYLGYIPLFD